MKKIFDDPATYIIAYVLVGMITFGNAYHRVAEVEQVTYGDRVVTVQNGVGTKAYGALLSSMVWPLYWSVQIWR